MEGKLFILFYKDEYYLSIDVAMKCLTFRNIKEMRRKDEALPMSRDSYFQVKFFLLLKHTIIETEV